MCCIMETYTACFSFQFIMPTPWVHLGKKWISENVYYLQQTLGCLNLATLYFTLIVGGRKAVNLLPLGGCLCYREKKNSDDNATLMEHYVKC